MGLSHEAPTQAKIDACTLRSPPLREGAAAAWRHGSGQRVCSVRSNDVQEDVHKDEEQRETENVNSHNHHKLLENSKCQ